MDATEETHPKKRASIFARIIVNVIIPEIIVFSVIAWFSYKQLDTLIRDNQADQIEHIMGEIENLTQITKTQLEALDRNLESALRSNADRLRTIFRDRNINPRTVDLNELRRELGMDANQEDIYIISKAGIIVNTTFAPDRNLNLFSLGEDLKSFLLSVFEEKGFKIEKFNIETATHSLKKFGYVTTFDGEYIIEIGQYGEESQGTDNLVKKRLSEIKRANPNVFMVDLFIAFPHQEVPLSWYAEDKSEVYLEDSSLIETLYLSMSDTLYQKDDSLDFHYTSSMGVQGMPQVSRVVFNTLEGQKIIESEIQTSSLIFLSGISVLFIILLINSRIISHPIKTLVSGARHLSEGELETRVTVEGTKETAALAEQFNAMASNLERQHYELLDQKNLLAEKNEEIMDSINYARNIQKAILPPDRLIHKHLPESFVMYLPKDVVAGDFYWMEAVDDWVIYAAADCTGHGVPGALVSVVCHNTLNRSVREFGLREPAKILDKTRELVVETFAQSEKDVKDGMDLALCAINYKTMELQYAGANNSLYLVQNGELSDTKPDKQAIGLVDDPKPFTNHSFKLNKGDVIYTTSDGFPDQFGGPKGKKFKYKPFKEMLVAMHQEPMAEQLDKLLKTFDEWKGELEQVDDVCVMGVRV